MNAQEFVAAWLEFMRAFLSKQKMGLAGTWHSKSSWTQGTIGPSHASGDNSPFGEHLVKYLGGEPWRIRKEYRDIDLVLSRRPNLRRPYLWTENDETEWGLRFYPGAMDIVIEHEDSCGISWQEMVKLVLVRAPLKVLITYTSDVRNRPGSLEISMDLIERTRGMFLDMIREAWTAFPEDMGTTYLLIIGQLDQSSPEAQINWYHTSFTYGVGIEHVAHHGPIIQPA